MQDLACPFSTPIVKKEFACQYAQEVIRRGGSEVACQEITAHALCAKSYKQIKVAALAAMELEDDLLTLPHNVLLKIQYGGLLGLQNIAALKEQGLSAEKDIATLVKQAQSGINAADELPLEAVSKEIINYKVQRRSKK